MVLPKHMRVICFLMLIILLIGEANHYYFNVYFLGMTPKQISILLYIPAAISLLVLKKRNSNGSE